MRILQGLSCGGRNVKTKMGNTMIMMLGKRQHNSECYLKITLTPLKFCVQEEFDKQLEDGTVPKELGKDSLTHVFGEEHGGCVRCAGKGVTPTNYWHLPRRGASKESVAELKKLLDSERCENQRESEKKDEQIKVVMAKMEEQTKMMGNLVSD
ncbi:hypothetical protein MKX03_008197 [Papaver bracteatum]|nr:hypothetical protein MKX03_008197 [Papaver bracteatum]